MRVEKCSVLGTLLATVICLSVPAFCEAQEKSLANRRNDTGSAQISSAGENRFKFSPHALQVARIIGVESDISRLSSLPVPKDLSAAPSTSLEELLLRQRITDAAIVASFDVDSVLDDLEYERDQVVALRNVFRARRDLAIGSTNLAVLAAGTGLGIVGGILSLSNTTQDAGNAISVAAGGVSTLFSLRGFRQVRGAKRSILVLPDMLTPFLSPAEERHKQYPDAIAAYLNSVPPEGSSQASRKEQVLAGWLAAGRVGPLDSPKTKQKIALLTSTNAADKKLGSAILDDRAEMLTDVRDVIAQMKHGLADLLRALRQP
jgi:hypothetical protein